MENKALVTVVTVTYNLINAGRKETFLQAVQSVRNQNYPHIQHLIIDGASNDGTIELIKELGLEYFSEPDSGIYDAMNKGIKHAKGKYIALLNSDDFYHDNRMVEKCVHSLEENNLDFVCSNMYHLNEEKPEENYTLYADFSNIFKLMPFGHPTLFCKTEILRRYSFDLQYKIAADYDFVFKLFLHGYKGIALPYTFTTFRIGGACAHDTINEAKGLRKKYLAHKNKILANASSKLGTNEAKLSILTLYQNPLTHIIEKQLHENKQSVQAQDYNNVEHICLEYQGNNFLIALKKALEEATGDYILILPPNATLSSTTVINKIMQRFAIEKIQAIYSDICLDNTNNANSISWNKLLLRKEFIDIPIPYQAFVYDRNLMNYIDFSKTNFDDYLFHIELFLQQGFAYGYEKETLVTIYADKENFSKKEQYIQLYNYLDTKSPYDKVRWKHRIKLFKKLTFLRTIETMWEKKSFLFGFIPLSTKKK